MKALHELLDRATRRWPESPAVRDLEAVWTYGELRTQSLAWATWLDKQGVRPGDRVAVTAVSHRAVVALVYACSRVGTAFVPLSATLKPFQLDQILSDAEPKLLVTAEMLATLRTAAAVPPAQQAEVALLIYTSGSTAPTPKAVVCPHQQALFATNAIAARLGYRQTDTVFCRLPLSFDYGLYQAFLCALAGAQLVLSGPGSDARMLTELNTCRATVVPIVPSTALMLANLARRTPVTAPVRLLTNTGERLPSETIKRLRACFPAASLVLMFGTTECKRICILEPDGDLLRPGSVGRPLDGTQLRIAGDDGEIMMPHATGEILVSGPHVMSGYWRAPELSAAAFRTTADGQTWLHTGDFGYLDAEGYLYFEGRRDNLFKRNGLRISTLEIEAAARDVPGVHEAVALPPTAEHELTMFASGDIDPVVLLRELARRLSLEKVPARCMVLEALPHTGHGKLDRTELVRLRAQEHDA